MSPDLVLKARLAMVRSSLETVQTVLSDLEGARHIGTGGDDSNSTEPGLVIAVRQAVRDLRALDGDDERVEAIARQLEDARTQHEQARKAVIGLAPRRLALTRTSVDQDLADEVNVRLRQLQAIERKMSDADQGPDHEGELTAAWDGYSAWQRKCLRVFKDYVDLVRGVLLRDAGLDKDLCRIADELARQSGRWRDYEWKAFTIPAADDQGDLSSLRLVRIGFPEWSVWTLPLTMYEIGLVFADVHRYMRPIVDEAGSAAADAERERAAAEGASPAETERRAASARELAASLRRAWIADAYATAVLGPTYVWAAMLLRADPASDRDDRRVAVMLEMLRATDSLLGARGTRAFADERARIEREWAAARRQVTSTGDLAPISRAGADVVKEVLFWIKVPFTAADWDKALDLTDEIEGDKPAAAIARDLITLNPLRHVFGGACRARIRLADERFEASPDLEDEEVAQEHVGFDDAKRAKAKLLAERTRAICIAIIDGDEALSPTEDKVTSSFPPNIPERPVDKTRYVPTSASGIV